MSQAIYISLHGTVPGFRFVPFGFIRYFVLAARLSAVAVGALLFVLATVLPVPAQADSLPDPVARRKAVDAFWALDQRAWDQSAWNFARAELQTAVQRNPRDPWVSIGYAKLALTTGYLSHSAYSSESIEAALRHAQKAVRDGPNESMTHAYYGLVLYSKGRNEEAWQAYQQAIRLDPKNPMPLFYTAQAILDVRDYRGLEHWLKRIEPLATRLVFRSRLHDLKRDLAASRNDAAEVERLFKADLAEHPDNPWLHGNYASFLDHQRRYDEAIRAYEKALAIMEYPMARAGLEQVRRRRAASRN